ncbi:MAG TPA: GNAT family N-acetyltransferase [Dongiaceae bacterium]|jgi:putative acetyltransferase|nr:GNAT family N-acetyltransferase [Dongiaceae bacterium]
MPRHCSCRSRAPVWRKRLTQNDDTQHTLVATVAGKVVGNLGLTRLIRPRRTHVGQIGMGVRDDCQGKGVGSALMEAALDLADNWLGLRRLELNVHADNEPAIALYRKSGFKIEGTHRAYSIRNGIYVDSALHGAHHRRAAGQSKEGLSRLSACRWRAAAWRSRG